MYAYQTLIPFAVAGSIAWFVTHLTCSTSPIFLVALNYLARPSIYPSQNHVFEAINTPSAWNGTYMSRNPHLWIYNLTVEDQLSLRAAVQQFQSTNKSIEKLTANDFPLSDNLQTQVRKWNKELSGLGRGFQVIRGVPVQHMTRAEIEIAFYGLGKHLGNPGSQDIQGSLFKQVIDVGFTNQTERPYRTRAAITYHCDGADIVALLCLHPAKQGGASRIVSTTTVYNQLLKHPKGQQYVRRLFDNVLLFTDQSFVLSPYVSMGYLWYSLWRKVVPFRLGNMGVLRSYWNQELGFVRSYRDTKTGEATAVGIADPLALEATEAYETILNNDIQDNPIAHGVDEVKLSLSMHLQQGDIQLLSNHFVLHGRESFTDYTPEEIRAASTDDSLRTQSSSSCTSSPSTHNTSTDVSDQHRKLAPIGQRELLRLWLTHSSNDLSWSDYFTKQHARAALLLSVAQGVFNWN